MNECIRLFESYAVLSASLTNCSVPISSMKFESYAVLSASLTTAHY